MKVESFSFSEHSYYFGSFINLFYFTALLPFFLALLIGLLHEKKSHKIGLIGSVVVF